MFCEYEERKVKIKKIKSDDERRNDERERYIKKLEKIFK
jgi:hypothetical protein